MLCSLVAQGRIEGLEVLEALGVGERIADRPRTTLTKTDRTTSEIEVSLFGTLDAQGRLRRVDEVSRVVVGGAADAALARALIGPEGARCSRSGLTRLARISITFAFEGAAR